VWHLSRSGNSSGKTLDEMIKLERGNEGISCSYETANAQPSFTKGAKRGHKTTNCLSIRKGLNGLITDAHINNPGTAAPLRAQAASLFMFPHTHTHTHTHTQSVRPTGPRTDRYVHNTQQTQETNSIHARSGIQIAFPANELLQTYALDLTATEIGSTWFYCACLICSK